MNVLARLKLQTGEADDAILLDCMESAKSAILSRRYPYGDWPEKTVTKVIPPQVETDPETGEETVVEEGRTEQYQETVLEPRYLDLQFRCALAVYNKRGGEFETSHTENNVTRVWGSEYIPNSLLEEVTPYCGLVK